MCMQVIARKAGEGLLLYGLFPVTYVLSERLIFANAVGIKGKFDILKNKHLLLRNVDEFYEKEMTISHGSRTT